MKSFSLNVKQELANINIWKNNDEILLQLYGYLLTFSGSKFITESEYNINCFAKILKNLNYNDFDIQLIGRKYIIKIRNYKKFKESYDVSQINDVLKKNNSNKENLIKSLVRGAFLGSGLINNPKNGYHLEIIFNNMENANIIKDELSNYNIGMKLFDDKNVILYLKGR